MTADITDGFELDFVDGVDLYQTAFKHRRHVLGRGLNESETSNCVIRQSFSNWQVSQEIDAMGLT